MEELLKEMLRQGVAWLPTEALGNFVEGMTYTDASRAVRAVWGADSKEARYIDEHYSVVRVSEEHVRATGPVQRAAAELEQALGRAPTIDEVVGHVGVLPRELVEKILANSLLVERASVRPRFKHDCDACIFLGQWTNRAVVYDLYVCPKEMSVQEGSTCCLARFGHDGPDYASMTLSNKLWDESLAAIGGPRKSMRHCFVPELCEAWRRWSTTRPAGTVSSPEAVWEQGRRAELEQLPRRELRHMLGSTGCDLEIFKTTREELVDRIVRAEKKVRARKR